VVTLSKGKYSKNKRKGVIIMKKEQINLIFNNNNEEVIEIEIPINDTSNPNEHDAIRASCSIGRGPCPAPSGPCPSPYCNDY
jgi:hypothetical protein